MFVIKINEKIEDKEFDKMIENIISYAKDASANQDLRIIKDSSSVEIVSGREPQKTDESEIVIEMMIKKRVVINNSDFRDKAKLDRHLFGVREFCKKFSNIEKIKYLPINMRSRKK